MASIQYIGWWWAIFPIFLFYLSKVQKALFLRKKTLRISSSRWDGQNWRRFSHAKLWGDYTNYFSLWLGIFKQKNHLVFERKSLRCISWLLILLQIRRWWFSCTSHHPSQRRRSCEILTGSVQSFCESSLELITQQKEMLLIVRSQNLFWRNTRTCENTLEKSFLCNAQNYLSLTRSFSLCFPEVSCFSYKFYEKEQYFNNLDWVLKLAQERTSLYESAQNGCHNGHRNGRYVKASVID